mgnify:CR=1 FL=1
MFKNHIVFDAPSDRSGGQPPAETKPADAPGGSGTGEPKAKAPIKLEFDSEDAHEAYLTGKLKDRLAQKEKQAQERERKAREEAEAKALEEGAQWQKLAEKRQTQIAELEKRIAELETVSQTAARYGKAIEAQLAAQLADVPEHIQALLTRMDPAERLEWLAANGEKLKTSAAPTQPAGFVPPTPAPAATGRANGLDALIERKLKSAEYAGL